MQNDKKQKPMLPAILATVFTAFVCTLVVQILLIFSAMRENPETFAKDFDFKGMAITFPVNLLTYCIVVLLIVMIYKKALSFCTDMFSKEERDQRFIDKFRRKAQHEPEGDRLKPAP